MTSADEQAPQPAPASFLTAEAALRAIEEAVRAARTAPSGEPAAEPPGPEQALAVLLLLRDVRHQLAGWEPGLIEAARAAGASWADLAGPLGVASRQAAERRYLRVRPGAAGSTGEQRVKATRDRRAADRTITAWARDNAGELRSLAGRIAALPDLPPAARPPVRRLARALADDDAARLLAPLTEAEPHLRPGHPELADRIERLTHHTDRLRDRSNTRRGTQT
ncbi:type III effector protein [Streptomyces sp. RS10V-4]|uniref:type III effector protein n=1 Tax=Streptomyces rhizoryzae TaxID=2932493 RepID=UPI002003BB7C|nr:type III effector protein [Streptomyces rhizoryzae]MCK7622538.1 type III effector protein [Streptomyces rhizoryzae]